MKKTSISTNAAPEAIGSYAQAICAGGLIFCSGQIALDPQTGEMVGAQEAGAQTHQVMRNLQAVLSEAQSSLGNAVKATIYLIDMNDFSEVDEVYGSYFEGEVAPARAAVAVAALPRGARVEIDLVATL